MRLWPWGRQTRILDEQTAAALVTWGPTAAGINLSRAEALELAPVWACVQRISSAMAGLQIYTEPESSPVLPLLTERANPRLTAEAAKRKLIFDALVHGNGIALIERTVAGEPIGLWPIDGWRVSLPPVRSLDDRTYWYYPPPGQAGSGTRVELDGDDLIHIYGMSSTGYWGISAVDRCRDMLAHYMAVERWGSYFFANASTPSGLLSVPDASPAQIADIAASWKSAHGGAQVHKTAIIGGDARWTMVGPTMPEQGQYLGTRQALLEEIARIFSVPPTMIGDLTHGTYSNVEMEQRSFVSHTLEPWIQAFRSELIAKLGVTTSWRLDALQRGAPQERAAYYATMIGAGIMTAEQAAEMEGIPYEAEEEEITGGEADDGGGGGDGDDGGGDD